MKHRLKPLALSLCLLGLTSTSVFAVESTDINQRTQALEQQVTLLQQEVSTLKTQKKIKHRVMHRTVVVSKKADSSVPISGPSNLPTLPKYPTKYMPIDLDVPGQAFVTTGPYLGVPLEYTGSNLLVNEPSINQDLALLKLRKNIVTRLEQLGITPDENHAHLLLSGMLEGQATYKQIGGGANSSDINLSGAGLDAYVMGPSPWISSMLRIDYDDDAGTANNTFSNNSRVENSRLFMSQAFFTIGNLIRTPFYGTFGQLFVPFGSYSSNMVSSPLTKSVARTKTRAVVLGYAPQGDNAMYASVFVFRGDSYADAKTAVNNGGINGGYKFINNSTSGEVGLSLIRNIADSGGMQNTGNSPLFGGFGGTSGSGSEKLAHVVPALDLRGKLSVGDSVDLLAEYITATRSFSTRDLTMNGGGAKPRALNAEAAYSFKAFTKPTSVAVGFGITKDVLALGLPEKRISATLNTSFWRNTTQSLEFRHDINYAASDSATGSSVTTAVTGTGRSNNIVTAQFDVYF